MNKLIVRSLMMMVIAMTLSFCSSDDSVNAGVNVNIKNADGKLVFLEDVNGSAPIALDTAVLEGNKASLTAELKPGIYRVRVANVMSRNPILLYMDNATQIKLEMDAKNPEEYHVKGNKESEVINEVLLNQSSFFNKVEEIRAQLNGAGNDILKADSLNRLMQDYYADANENVKTVINANQDINPHANALLLNLLSPQTEGQFIVAELKKYLVKEPNSQFITSMGQRFGLGADGQPLPQPTQPSGPSGIAIGEVAPDIQQANPKGEIMSLSSLQGKYVLIDFWASWCKPCRIENPNVVRTYNKYKDKGFEIFSVSLDKSSDRWEKAIKDDGLVWDYHVSDLKAWSNEAARTYGVGSIPATFLIDPEGKVIAKNLRGPALENKLVEVLGDV
ncbi:MAG: TlpA disulfide reductase family protein [Chitinophagales bacterium]